MATKTVMDVETARKHAKEKDSGRDMLYIGEFHGKLWSPGHVFVSREHAKHLTILFKEVSREKLSADEIIAWTRLQIQKLADGEGPKFEIDIEGEDNIPIPFDTVMFGEIPIFVKRITRYLDEPLGFSWILAYTIVPEWGHGVYLHFT